ncbi:hypothetical protein Gotur_004183 [Gossypium turneri]
MTSRRKGGWKFFGIFARRILNGELIGCFQMRSCIDVVLLIGFHYLGFGELLAMHHC